jgi:hypothetical protein
MGSTVGAWEFKCKKCKEVHYVPYELFDDKTQKSITVSCIKDKSQSETYSKNDFHFTIGDHEKISSKVAKIIKPQ